MASFGQGFSGGLMAGARIGDVYNDRMEEEAQGKLFNAAMGLNQEGQELQAMGEKRQGVMNMFGQASMGDITQTIVDNFAANGGKINDQTYKLATGVASTLFGVAQGEKEYQQKNSLFKKKIENIDSQIGRRNLLNSRKPQGAKPTKLERDYDWMIKTKGQEYADKWLDHKTKTGGGATQGYQPTTSMKNDRYCAENPDAFSCKKRDAEYNMYYGSDEEDETLAEPTTQPETKKASWKDYL